MRQTFSSAATMASSVMLVFVALCHIAPDALIRFFSGDPQVIAIGGEYLRIVSWNFVPSAVAFVASSMFQAIGNTIPSLITSVVRLVIVAVPSFMLAQLPRFELRWLWYLSVAAVVVQMTLSVLLLQRELRRRLDLPDAARSEAQPNATAP